MGGNPAPEPIVLRGHGGDVQCVAFTTLGGVECLLSGDSNGDVVAWDLALRRPLWRLAAHPPSSGVLSVEAMPGGASCPPGDTSERGETSATRVLTQGRDGTLKCWRASGADAPSPDPAWSVTSGSFHFCRFASARDVSTTNLRALAVVGAETSAVDVLAVLADAADAPPAHARTFRVPTECSYEKKRSETWDASLRGAPEGKLGTVMACAFLFAPFASGEATDETSPRGGALLLVVGYEEGTVALWDCERVGDGTAAPPPLSEADERDAKPFRAAPAPARVSGAPLWRERAHGDAVTSIAADTRRGGFVSASADGGVLRFSVRAVRETIREDESESSEKTNETKTRVSFSTRVSPSRASARRRSRRRVRDGGGDARRGVRGRT
jgi:WD40 repeat protein